jgi:sugar phosphate isomerase/epimerase
MLAITTDSLAGYSLDRTFEIAKAAGLDGIEVVIRHGEFDTQNPTYLKKLSERYKLPIIALSAPIEMNATKANKVIALAEKIGVSMVTLTPPDIFDFNYKKWLREEAPGLRRKKKLKIALVNPPVKMMFGIFPKYAFNDVYDLREFEDIAFDTSNAIGRTEPLLEIYSILKTKICHIHLSNTKHEQDHTLLNNGNVPLESFLARLARDKNALVLKFNPKSLKVGDDVKVIQHIEDSKKFINKYFKTS